MPGEGMCMFVPAGACEKNGLAVIVSEFARTARDRDRKHR